MEKSMDRKEFLDELKECLEGEIPEYEIKSHVEYYDDYFKQKVKEGNTEKEVAKKLGSPRLIAKTLKNTSNLSGSSYSKSYDYSSDYTSDTNSEAQSKIKFKDRIKQWTIDVVLGRKQVNTVQKVLGILALVLFFALIMGIFYFILNIAFTAFPIIFLILILIYFFAEKR